MILTTKRHGRTARDTRNLTSHLGKQVRQVSRVVAIGNCPLSHADDALAYMEAMRDGSRADVAYHHVTINPSKALTDNQRDEAVRRIMEAMDADGHAFILWEHSEKARNSTASVDVHYHLVVSHVGEDGKALRDSGSYRKLEAVARSLEVDFGENLTLSRRTQSVAAQLVEMGRDDVAQQLPIPDELPRSSMTSGARASADRQGINLPAAQAAIKAAWEQSDSSKAFSAAIAEMGLTVSPGRKDGVFIVTAGTVEVGALDRIVKQRRKDVASKMEGYDRDPEPPKNTAGIGPSKSHESDLPAEQISKRSGAAASATAHALGSAGGRRYEPSRDAAGHPRDDPAGATAPPSEPGRSPREGRRPKLEEAQLNRSLKGFQPSLAAQQASAEIKARSLPRAFPRLTSALLDRALGSSALDRVWRLAWDVRDVIQDVRLRIKYGKAQRHSSDPDPTPEISSPDRQRHDVLAAVRARILAVRQHEAEYSPPAFKM